MPEITINKDRCKSCLLCISVCPKNAIKLSERPNKKGLRPVIYIGGECIGCAQCALICPDACIEVYR